MASTTRPRTPRAPQGATRAAKRKAAEQAIADAETQSLASGNEDWREAHERYLSAVDHALAGLDAKDQAIVDRNVARRTEAKSQAARIIAQEYARTEAAKKLPAALWLLRTLATTEEDLDVITAVLRFLDRRGVSPLVDSWSAPDDLLDAKLRNSAASERAFQRLQAASFPDEVIARALGESPTAHRMRSSAARRHPRREG